MSSARLRLQAGVTLVELMVTLAVVAIVLVWGLPSFRELIATSRLANAANGLIGHFQYARLEAVNRNARVAVCPSLDGHACNAASAPQDWSGGYIVALVDDNQPPNVLHVLRRVDAQDFGGIAASSGGRSRIVFQSDGSAMGNNGTVRFVYGGDATRARSVTVNDVGRAFVN